MKVWKVFEKGFPASKLVINDRIDIAILLNIPRVQLGYRSTDVRSVKEKFSYLHVGYSVHSLEEAIEALRTGLIRSFMVMYSRQSVKRCASEG